jgi:hypothetical protein
MKWCDAAVNQRIPHALQRHCTHRYNTNNLVLLDRWSMRPAAQRSSMPIQMGSSEHQSYATSVAGDVDSRLERGEDPLGGAAASSDRCLIAVVPANRRKRLSKAPSPRGP